MNNEEDINQDSNVEQSSVTSTSLNEITPSPNQMEGLGQQEQTVNVPVETLMPQAPIAQESGNNLDGPTTVKKKSKLIPIIITIIIIGALGVFGFLYYKNSRKQMIMVKSFEYLQAKFIEESEFDFALPKLAEYIETGKITVNGTSNDQDVKEILNEYTKYSIIYDFEKKTNSLYYNIALQENNNALIDVQALAENNKLYLFAEKIFDKVIDFDYNTDVLVKDNYVTVDDYLYLYEFIIKSTFLNIESESYSQDKVTINLDGKDVDAKKTTISLDQESMITLFNKVIDELKNDERANGILNKLSDDFKDFKFDDSYFAEKLTVNYSTYTIGLMNDVVGFDFEYIYKDFYLYNYEDSEESKDLKYTFEYRSGETDTFNFIDGESVTKIVLKKEKNNLNIKVYDPDNNEVMEAIIQCSNSNSLNASVEFKSEDFNLKLTWDVNVDQVITNKEYKINNNVSLSIDIDGISMTIDANADILLKDISSSNIKKFDFSKSINYENLTDKDYEIMYNNFMKVVMGEEAWEQQELENNSVSVPYAKVDIVTGTVITEDMIGYKYMDADIVYSDYYLITSASSIIGTKSKIYIPAGSTFYYTDIE